MDEIEPIKIITDQARGFNERIMYLILKPGELTKEEWDELFAYEREIENV